MKLVKIIPYCLFALTSFIGNASAQKAQKATVKQSPAKSCAESKSTSTKTQKAESIHSHELGFSSLKSEAFNISLPITGSVPEWLHGSFITIGPSIFELNQTKADHWLDGFAMIHQFALEKGTAKYTNK